MDNWKDFEIRCSRLGHEIKFSYCEREGGDMPCSRIMQCWQGLIPVEPYLRCHMPLEKWERFISLTTKDKITSLLELIEAIKKR